MLLINYLKRNLNKTIYNYFFILQLASVIAKIIDKKPTINFKVISSLSIKEPSKIADKGLNPREIAAWVGEIKNKYNKMRFNNFIISIIEDIPIC